MSKEQKYILDRQVLTLGEVLLIYRRRKGLVNKDLKDAGWDIEFVSAVENDEYDVIQLGELIEYAAFLGLQLSVRIAPRKEIKKMSETKRDRFLYQITTGYKGNQSLNFRKETLIAHDAVGALRIFLLGGKLMETEFVQSVELLKRITIENK